MYNRFPHRPPALAAGKFSRKDAKSQKVERDRRARFIQRSQFQVFTSGCFDLECGSMRPVSFSRWLNPVASNRIYCSGTM
jgi:hypothetical protein